MASDIYEHALPVTEGRADIARLQLRLRQAKRRLAEAESEVSMDAEAARSALIAQLAPMLDQRRLSMDAEIETARAAADRHREAAAREAIAIVEQAERAVREQLARDQAEVALREQHARAEAEVALREQHARQQAEAALREQTERQRASQSLDEQAARARGRTDERAPLAAVPTVAPILPPQFLPIVQIVDGPVSAEPMSVSEHRQLGAALASTGVTMNDPEVFARAVATVLAAVVGERGVHPQQVVVQAPVVRREGFWASARHLDVLLLGLSTVVVLVVLAAWLA